MVSDIDNLLDRTQRRLANSAARSSDPEAFVLIQDLQDALVLARCQLNGLLDRAMSVDALWDADHAVVMLNSRQADGLVENRWVFDNLRSALEKIDAGGAP